MASSESGGRISRVMEKMGKAAIIDENVLNECLDEIGATLLSDGVRSEFVRDMLRNIKATSFNLEDLAACPNDCKIIQKTVFNELCKRFDTGKPSFTPVKGSPSVIIFVGLQGSWKTKACTKYAHYHRQKGWKPALVCADTGDLDQLKQIAAEAEVPVYESYTESDPATIAAGGVETFKNEDYDLIIVVSGGRHKQEAALFEELRRVSEATKPDLVVMVMDTSVGQAAFGQAQAFKQSVPAGAVIVTKMHSHSKGVGALSAVAEAKTPVIFMGTGEHLDDFVAFDVKPFFSSLLGLGDWTGFTEGIRTVPMDERPKRPHNRLEGDTSLKIMLRLLRDQHTRQVTDAIKFHSPRFQEILEDTQRRIRRYETIMEPMTNAELESTNPELIMDQARIEIIARESCQHVDEVMEMLEKRKANSKWRAIMTGIHKSRRVVQATSAGVDV